MEGGPQVEVGQALRFLFWLRGIMQHRPTGHRVQKVFCDISAALRPVVHRHHLLG